jgi:pentatricopeptide repeat protein
MDAVPQFLQDMRGWKLQPNIITFSTLVKGFCQRGDIPAAMKILEDVRKDPHLQPDEVMFNTILDGCAANGLVAEGERVFAEMQAQGLQPGNYAVSLLVKMLGSVRKVGRAFELVEEITRKCRLKPNGQVYESLIQAALNGHDLSRALATFEKMGRQHIHANGRTCQALVRGCLANRGFAQAAGVLRLALGLGGAEGTDKRVKLEPSFVGEAIRTMAQDKDSANLAAELVDEIRLHKPKFRLDPALQGTGGPAGLSGAVDSQRLACKPLESPCE